MHENAGMEAKLNANTLQRRAQKKFLDIATAAYEAGYPTRHFRKIIDEDRIPTLQIGSKQFILSQDLEAWKETKGEFRFQQMIQQLDGWLKRPVSEPAISFDDFDED